jgi:glycosyltransferase involved in cell wall biosynthesis
VTATGTPLLSICLPCYNGGRFLPAVLEALLPQAAEAGDRVEVLIVDDKSTDGTSEIVAAASQLGPSRYIANPQNLGMSNNIVSATTVHARGEFVWVLSQHNLMMPGGLGRVLDAIGKNPSVDAFYVNFRAAKYPAQWPAHAVGGFDGPFHYLCRAESPDEKLDRWEEVLDARTSVGTQTYAHVVRRKLVKEFWASRTIGRDFSNAIDTYSQTFAVASVMFGRPAVLVGSPVMTIFDGAQTWGSLDRRAKVYLNAHPDLLDEYARLGWSGEKLREAQRQSSARAAAVVFELMRADGFSSMPAITDYLMKYRHHDGAVASALRAVVAARTQPIARATSSVNAAAHNAREYFLHNWRPARWVRGRAR